MRRRTTPNFSVASLDASRAPSSSRLTEFSLAFTPSRALPPLPRSARVRHVQRRRRQRRRRLGREPGGGQRRRRWGSDRWRRERNRRHGEPSCFGRSSRRWGDAGQRRGAHGRRATRSGLHRRSASVLRRALVQHEAARSVHASVGEPGGNEGGLGVPTRRDLGPSGRVRARSEAAEAELRERLLERQLPHDRRLRGRQVDPLQRQRLEAGGSRAAPGHHRVLRREHPGPERRRHHHLRQRRHRRSAEHLEPGAREVLRPMAAVIPRVPSSPGRGV